MGTEVLRPHDCLTHRIGISPAVFHRRRTTYYGYGNGIPKVNKAVIRSERPVQLKRSPEQRKRSPVQLRRSPEQRRSPEPLTTSKRSASAGDLMYKHHQMNNNNNLVVAEKVKILRRGESLVSIVGEETVVYGTGRLGPDPQDVMKQVRVGLQDVYAGSAATMSPSPRALPVPSFFKKGGGEKFVDDSATKDIRRLLRLD